MVRLQDCSLGQTRTNLMRASENVSELMSVNWPSVFHPAVHSRAPTVSLFGDCFPSSLKINSAVIYFWHLWMVGMFTTHHEPKYSLCFLEYEAKGKSLTQSFQMRGFLQICWDQINNLFGKSAIKHTEREGEAHLQKQKLSSVSEKSLQCPPVPSFLLF